MIEEIFLLSIVALGAPLLAIPFTRKRASWLIAQLALLSTLILVLLAALYAGRPVPLFGGEVEVDPISIALLVIGLVDTLIAVHGSGDLVEGYPDPSGFFSVVLLAALGILGIAFSNTSIMLMTSWILFSVASFALMALPKDDYSVKAAVKYAIMGSASSTLLFLSFGIMLFLSGSLHFIGATFTSPKLLSSVLLFLMAAVGFKIGVFPFHSWLPDTYGEADPVPVALISSIAKIGGILALYRAAKILAGPMGFSWLLIVALFAAATMFYGNITALLQGEIQRLLAYSSIAQAGYLLVGAAALTAIPGVNREWAVYGIAFQLAAYSFAKTGTFLTVKAVRRRGDPPPKLESLAGLYLEHPVLAGSFAVLIFSLMGMPPLAGFWGKLFLFFSVVGAAPWLTAFALINTGIAAAYYARAIKAVYFEKKTGGFQAEPSMLRAVAACAAATIIVGIIPFFLAFI